MNGQGIRNGVALFWLIVALWISTMGVIPAAQAAQAESREWRFRVLLDDDEIGYHSFRLADDGVHRVVESEARFRVRVLFFEAYRYDHVNREHWGEDCLVGVDATTRVNGKLLSVEGFETEEEFVLRTDRGEQTLARCVMSFAYWNPAFLDQTRLLNTQTGEYVAVDIRAVGEEVFSVRGKQMPARRYSLSADKLNMDLWYSPDRQWLGLESITRGGRRLRYELL